MMRIAIKLKVNPRDNQIGMKSKAKAEYEELIQKVYVPIY